MSHELFYQSVADWKPIDAPAPEIKENDLLQRILDNQKDIEEGDFTPETPEPDNSNLDSDTANNNEQHLNEPFTEPDNPNKGTIAGLFTPESAINLFDVVMARLGALGCRYMDYNVGVNDLKLNASEKATLRPHLYEVMKRMNLVTDNPYAIFLIAAASIYGVKILEAQSNVPPVEKKKNVQAAKSPLENINAIKPDRPAPKRDSNGHFISTKPKDGNEIKRPVGRPKKNI